MIIGSRDHIRTKVLPACTALSLVWPIKAAQEDKIVQGAVATIRIVGVQWPPFPKSKGKFRQKLDNEAARSSGISVDGGNFKGYLGHSPASGCYPRNQLQRVAAPGNSCQIVDSTAENANARAPFLGLAPAAFESFSPIPTRTTIRCNCQPRTTSPKDCIGTVRIRFPSRSMMSRTPPWP